MSGDIKKVYPTERHFYNKKNQLCRWLQTNGEKTLVIIEEENKKLIVDSNIIKKYLKENPKQVAGQMRWRKGKKKR